MPTTTNQYGSVSAAQRSTIDQPVENEYDNVDELLSKDKSNYKDWNDAENPAPAHYDKIVANQQAIDAGYVDIDHM
jgi:hypothetical protein